MAIQLKSCGVLLLIVIILYINHVKSDMIADEHQYVERVYDDYKEWTWISGSNKDKQSGNYGIKGVQSNLNFPGSRQKTISWIDNKNHILYLFGGIGYGKENTSYGLLNDLWSYSIKDGIWTWISGLDNLDNVGIYGTKGNPSEDNYPGSRYGSVSWSEITNDNMILYLFGGIGIDGYNEKGYLNDLWSYSIKDGIWTWISGSDTINQQGIYGIKGESSIDNQPGSRFSCVSWFNEENKIAYIFGGYGYGDSLELGVLNDLWMYSFEDGLWTWISGNNEINQVGIYENDELYPGSRYQSISWYNKNKNILYLFSGLGYGSDKERQGRLNDLWAYSAVDNQWLWITGNDSINLPGNYGTKGVPSSENYPSSRFSSVSWLYDEDILYLFGGYGYGNDSKSFELLNDLWAYSIQNNTWIWISGSNIISRPGYYGNKGVPSKNNTPGSREGSVSFVDSINQRLYLFGGNGYHNESSYGLLNDLWSYSLFELIVKENGIECNQTSCYIDKDIEIDDTIIIDFNLTITDDSTIIIPPSLNDSLFDIINETIINIDGGKLIIDFEEDKYIYKDIINEIIKFNKSKELIIIKGKYNGSFDYIEIKIPNDIELCEILNPEFKENEDKTVYSVIFTVDNSHCSKIKWWVILIIVIGTLLIISLITGFIFFRYIKARQKRQRDQHTRQLRTLSI